jgi:hypothetical protein
MSLITSDIGVEGALVEVVVSVFAARRETLNRMGMPVPQPRTVKVQIDTGAYRSGFDRRVFSSLSLREPIDTENIRTSSTDEEPHPAPVYYVALSLRGDKGERTFESIRVLAHFFGDEEEAQGALGRDILDLCHFTYDGVSRRFMLSF